MLGNLYISLKQKKISQADLARLLNLSANSVNRKLLGKREFKSSEMLLIQKKFFPEQTLEFLFYNEEK